jgi:hypothetical protein
MALWKRLWLLFTVIWVVVAGLNAATILLFAEGVERGKALTPLALAVAVPALLYLLGWLWQRWKARK